MMIESSGKQTGYHFTGMIVLPVVAIIVSIASFVYSWNTQHTATASAAAIDPPYVSADKNSTQIKITNGSRHDIEDVYVFSGWEDFSWSNSGEEIRLIRWHPDDIPACTSVILTQDAHMSARGPYGDPNPTSGALAFLFWTDVSGTAWSRQDQADPFRIHKTSSMDTFSDQHKHMEVEGADGYVSISYTGGACVNR